MSKAFGSSALNLVELARRQLADYDRHEPGTAFADGLRLSIAQAYEVQSLVAELRERRGEPVMGYKVGCTSPTIRKSLRIDHPIYGRLFKSECWPSGRRLPLSEFCGLAIEGELAARLARDLPNVATREEISNAIDAVFPVIELHNLIFRRGVPSADELIANNAIHGGFVCGENGSQRFDRDPAQLRIFIDDVLAVNLAGPELIDTVAHSLSWLAAELNRLGRSLRAGQTILCGSVGDLIPIPCGCRVSVTTDRFGSVECTIVEGG